MGLWGLEGLCGAGGWLGVGGGCVGLEGGYGGLREVLWVGGILWGRGVGVGLCGAGGGLGISRGFGGGEETEERCSVAAGL